MTTIELQKLPEGTPLVFNGRIVFAIALCMTFNPTSARKQPMMLRIRTKHGRERRVYPSQVRRPVSPPAGYDSPKSGTGPKDGENG